MLILTRHLQNSGGTLGVLSYDGLTLCHTYERPWMKNLPHVSCVPAGLFPISFHISPKHGECFLLSDVPGRSSILIHPGNGMSDTHGCILPGLDVSRYGVVKSREAMSRLISVLPRRFHISIRDAFYDLDV